jgi:hypothetical protein
MLDFQVGYYARHGLAFLVENFQGKERLARSVNHLLLVGFYLVNIGFVSLALRMGTRPHDTVEAIEFLSTKIGLVVVVLGFMHFFNMIWLMRFRRSSMFRMIEPKAEAAPTATPGEQIVA